jgi:ATP-dependent DNA helicase PIF1
MKIKSQKSILKRYTETKVLIIDEISMLNSDFFDSLNEVFKILRDNTKPFGGVQLILTGDFFQLPPIQKTNLKTSKREEIKVQSNFLKLHHENYDPEIHQGYSDKIIDDGRFLFDSKSWYELIMCGMQIRQLTQGFRQKDLIFTSILDDIRLGVHSPEMFKFLVPNYRKKFNDSEIKPTYLSAYRRRADMYNAIELKKLPGYGHTYDSIEYVTNEELYWPDVDPIHLKKVFYNIQSHPHLQLKVGAQVILLRNINPKDGLANGSRGVITGFTKTKDEITKMELYLPLVRFLNGKTFVIGYHEFKSELDEQLTVVRYQIPLKLGWGITIHKSQGMTLDRAVIQIERSFAPGHAYVALSRVKDLEGLSLKQFSKKSIWVSERVKTFYNDIVNKSSF